MIYNNNIINNNIDLDIVSRVSFKGSDFNFRMRRS